MPNRPQYELFTDGACTGNPGPGGWAFILREVTIPNGEEFERTGGEARTTNNRMELMAVIAGLQALPAPSEVVLHADSQYVTKGLSEWLDGWKRKGWRTTSGPVKNVDLWKTLDQLRTTHLIRPVWVRGHADHPENTRCDRLAVEASRQFGGG